MSRRKNSVPSYRLHRASGQAVVTLNGVDHYLGIHGTAASKREYDRVTGEWLARGRLPSPPSQHAGGMTVKELILAYWRHVERRYRDADGQPTREAEHVKASLKLVRELYGDAPATEFGPVAFEAVREAMIDRGLARTTIRDRLSRVKRWIRWGVARELIAADSAYRLEAVEPLEMDRDGVKETDPVKPVSRADVDAVLPLVEPTIRAMIELQWLAGMRPGEVCRITTGAIDRASDPWVYRPAKHKTRRKGKPREIYLGALAQAILLPWLKANPDAPLFSPAESVQARNVVRRENRKTPMTPSQRARRPKREPKRTPRDRYDKDSYARPIRRACMKAGIPEWSPNQIRHSFATRIRREHGLEAAQVLLGHSKCDVTQVYAERNVMLARQVIRDIG